MVQWFICLDSDTWSPPIGVWHISRCVPFGHIILLSFSDLPHYVSFTLQLWSQVGRHDRFYILRDFHTWLQTFKWGNEWLLVRYSKQSDWTNTSVFSMSGVSWLLGQKHQLRFELRYVLSCYYAFCEWNREIDLNIM